MIIDRWHYNAQLDLRQREARWATSARSIQSCTYGMLHQVWPIMTQDHVHFDGSRMLACVASWVQRAASRQRAAGRDVQGR